MKYFIKENTLFPKGMVGWGNGYVLIPEGHIYHGEHYDVINAAFNTVLDENVHGGLTFSRPFPENIEDVSEDWKYLFLNSEYKGNEWIVGFDTCHYGDNPIEWTKERVLEETLKLVALLEEF